MRLNGASRMIVWPRKNRDFASEFFTPIAKMLCKSVLRNQVPLPIRVIPKLHGCLWKGRGFASREVLIESNEFWQEDTVGTDGVKDDLMKCHVQPVVVFGQANEGRAKQWPLFQVK